MDFFLNVFVVLGILGLSAAVTWWFSRAMYVTCTRCGALNARRRTHCRKCLGQL